VSHPDAPGPLADELDPRLPCLVGTGRHTWHPDGPPAPEPLEMWSIVARLAADDAGASVDPIAHVDDLSVVHCQSWAYDHPSARAADRLGTVTARLHESILAGTSPQRLLDAAARRMLRGECEVALVVGAEAAATRRAYERAGEPVPWSHPHPTPPRLPIELEAWYLPTEIAHGVLPAWLTFALLEQARWAARGATAAGRAELARTMGRLQAVAASNPDAWFRGEALAGDPTQPGAANRMVATPYAKRMTAFPDVDMAAANLLVTKAVADAWGVPEERRAYLRGWGFARDAVHLAARDDLASSPGMRAATAEALAVAGMTVDDIDAFDLYSCFGSAVQFALDALGLDVDDPRPISLTGGLPYHGGPSSNFVGHSTSHALDHLRANPGRTVMVTGVGMHMTKHVAGIWSTRPGPIGQPPDHGEQRWAGHARTEVPVHAVHHGPARVVAATAVHGRDGAPEHAIAICELPDGGRCYARTTDEEAIAAVAADAWAGATVELAPTEHGTNELRWGAGAAGSTPRHEATSLA
jgi:acetyl-CoA C-acetyltransferase